MDGDPNSMTIREVLTGIVIPRLEAIDRKVDERMTSFDRWRSKMNGMVVLATPLAIAAFVSSFFH